VHEGVCVTAVSFNDGAQVMAVDEHGVRQESRARELVDATGHDTFLATRLGLKKKNPKHGSATIFGHFNNVVRLTGRDQGNIGILWFEHGWFWMVPLENGMMSVGAVCVPEYLKTRGTIKPGDFLWQTTKLCPGVWARMRAAALIGEARYRQLFISRLTSARRRVADGRRRIRLRRSSIFQ
jgi:flavin-dependent dehydrogenase